MAKTKATNRPVYDELRKCLTHFQSQHDEPGKITRHLGFLWIEHELGGLNPTREQRRKVIALATQMGMSYGDAQAIKHCHVLDFILDRITECLCPEEWAANEARLRAEWERSKQANDCHRGQTEVFAAYYGGRNELLRELGIDPSELGGRRPKHNLV